MSAGTQNFDALASALFDGPIKAADFKIMPGENIEVNRETRSKALLDSMTRLGIVVDGHLTNLYSN